jgi:hypothetical protein
MKYRRRIKPGKTDMEKYFDSNKKIWNDRVPVHAKSSFYAVRV